MILTVRDLYQMVTNLMNGVVSSDPQDVVLTTALIALPVVIVVSLLLVCLVYSCEDCFADADARKAKRE